MNKIEKVKNTHKNDLCKLYIDFIKETGATQPDDISTNFDEFITSKECGLYIQYYENIPVGFIEYRKLPNKLRDKNGVVEITSMYVSPNYRKYGLGRALIDAVEQYCKEYGNGFLVLYSGLELENAHVFYEKVGFVKKAYYFGKLVK